METSIHYIARTSNLETEKAFSTDFPVEHVEGALRTNTQPHHCPKLVTAIEDFKEWDLDVHGFCVLHGKTHLDADRAYKDKSAVQDAYWHEIEAILHQKFPEYSRIECFDFTVRKRDPEFPDLVRVYRDEYEQPSPVAHCDWSQNGSLAVLHWCFPGNESFWEGKKFDMLNVWRPLKEPSDDWPLAICDYNTIDKEHDILLNDAIRRDRVEEICVLHFNEAHRWYYLKNQGIDDLMVFRNADSHGEKPRGFHAAVYNLMSHGPPRESVERLSQASLASWSASITWRGGRRS